MNRAAAVPIIARWEVGRPGAVVAFVRVWGRGSVVAALMTLGMVLAGEGAPGDLDPTLDVGGKVITNFGMLEEGVRALVLQPDGKLVAAGCSAQGGLCWDFALARYIAQQPVFNDFVTFEPIPSTSTFTPDPTGCPEGFVGRFSFAARLTNSSESSLTDRFVAVTTLTQRNLLQNADGCPGGCRRKVDCAPTG